LELIVSLKDEIPQDRSQLIVAASNFVNKTLHPILVCLENHHNDDKQSFIRKWTEGRRDIPFSRFFQKCRGKPDTESCIT
jgi:hypothetical protein